MIFRSGLFLKIGFGSTVKDESFSYTYYVKLYTPPIGTSREAI
ncbi:hypothetical protein J5U22_01568 [Saccharolobus shibatae]|uniref:Uncharacterized protein n=1 Tax=Saccharolobus shibatae TaxID=2286 RepID=A0A8F5C0Z1_9CREN|nr:hypothetical protein J5U22_01568 [Saccharolobus shibatae]